MKRGHNGSLNWVLSYLTRYDTDIILRNGPRIIRACDSVRKEIDVALNVEF